MKTTVYVKSLITITFLQKSFVKIFFTLFQLLLVHAEGEIHITNKDHPKLYFPLLSSPCLVVVSAPRVINLFNKGATNYQTIFLTGKPYLFNYSHLGHLIISYIIPAKEFCKVWDCETRTICSSNLPLPLHRELVCVIKQLAFSLFQMMKHYLVVLLVFQMSFWVSGEISGDLGLGWHFVVKDISLKDLEPTRTPRQIIGSRW